MVSYQRGGDCYNMKCNRCGSEWKTTTYFGDRIKVCPFCKAQLQLKESSLKETFRWLVQDRGIDVFKKSGIINAVLSDLVREDEKGRRKIKTALSAGAGTEFFNIICPQGVLNDIGRKQFISALSDCGFSLDFCDFVIDIFAYSIEYEMAVSEKEKTYKSTRDDTLTKIIIDKTEHNEDEISSNECEDGHCIQHNKDGSVTEGTKKNGEWDGNFKKTHKSGAYYEGTYRDGKINGELTYVHRNGGSTVGIWENGNWNGKCIIDKEDASITEGTRKDGVWEGHFKKTYKDGSYCEGLYNSNKVSGELTYVNSKGYSTVGIWENDNWNGKCKVENEDDSITEGTRVNGVWSGSFTITYKNGASFKGTFVNGDIDGKVTCSYENGNVFNCEWHNGTWNGDGEYKSKHGILKGLWVDGEIQGKGYYRYNNGQIYEGEILNFKRNGKGIIKFPSHGVLLEASFKDDIVVGNATITFPNGDVYTGAWHNMIEGYGTFKSKNCLEIRQITYSGTWKSGMLSGSGKLTVIPNRGVTVLYDGNFAFGKVSGGGYLYNVDTNGAKEPIVNGKWKDNKLDSSSKSKAIKDGEKTLSTAVDYIKTVTVMVSKLIKSEDC